MKNKRAKKSNTQPAVKIDRLLYLELKKWLETDQAQRLGFDSISKVVSVASRELLRKYRFPNNPR